MTRQDDPAPGPEPVRHDESDQNVFNADKTVFLQGNDSVAVELGYYF